MELSAMYILCLGGVYVAIAATIASDPYALLD